MVENNAWLEPDAAVSERLKRDFGTRNVSLYDVVVDKNVQGGRIAVGTLATTTESGTFGDPSSRSETQTAAYYMSDALRLPTFTLQPSGVMLKLLFRMAGGFEKIEFPAFPEFSQNYHLSGGVNPENTRRLFSQRILEALNHSHGLHVESTGSSLLVYRPRRHYAPQDLEGFVAETAQLFVLFEESGRKLNGTPETFSTARPDARAVAERMPGFLGEMFRQDLVTRAEAESFVRQPAPRSIPPNILRYCERWSPKLVVYLGVVFFVTGAAFAVAFALDEKPLGIALGLIFVAVGAPLAFIVGRSRLRTVRLLREGELCAARIASLEDSGWLLSTAGSIFRLKLRFQAQGGAQDAVCWISGYAGERAQRLVDERKPAPILYDRANPQRVLFVEDLLSADPEFEP